MKTRQRKRASERVSDTDANLRQIEFLVDFAAKPLPVTATASARAARQWETLRERLYDFRVPSEGGTVYGLIGDGPGARTWYPPSYVRHHHPDPTEADLAALHDDVRAMLTGFLDRPDFAPDVEDVEDDDAGRRVEIQRPPKRRTDALVSVIASCLPTPGRRRA